MKLVYDNNGSEKSNEGFEESDVDFELNKLDPITHSYVRLELDNGDFIQCAGSISSLTIEMRLHSQSIFKHFVIGKMEMSKVWHSINCKVGPIRVLGHEELDIQSAIIIFKYFYTNGSVPPSYNKRNITKQFK